MIERSVGTKYALIAALALSLAACGNAVGPEVTDVEFAESLGIDLDDFTETASGLYIREDSIGTGAPAELGDGVTVFFTGWLADGTEFDSGTLPITALGTDNLIAGFTEGVVGMQVDGIRTLVLPADLAFGSSGSGDVIPGDAVVVFEITCLSIVKPPS